MSLPRSRREAFRKTIRSKYIQDFFQEQRKKLLQEREISQSMSLENYELAQSQVLPFHYERLLREQSLLEQIRSLLKKTPHSIQTHTQVELFRDIVTIKSPEICLCKKLQPLCALIVRREFSAWSEVESFGWKMLVENILEILAPNRSQLQPQQLIVDRCSHKPQFSGLLSCTLVKLWELHPVSEDYTAVMDALESTVSENSDSFTFALISALSSDKNLIPSQKFMRKILSFQRVDSISKLLKVGQTVRNFLTSSSLCSSDEPALIRQFLYTLGCWISRQFKSLLQLRNRQEIQVVRDSMSSTLNAFLLKLRDLNRVEIRDFDWECIRLKNKELFSVVQECSSSSDRLFGERSTNLCKLNHSDRVSRLFQDLVGEGHSVKSASLYENRFSSRHKLL